jgi:hypothetical protein
MKKFLFATLPLCIFALMAPAQEAVNAYSYLEPDASNFCARAELTSLRQINAINTLVRELKRERIWTNLDVCWPFVGGTSNRHALNLVSTNYSLTWSNAVTHSVAGITGNGSNAFANTTYYFAGRTNGAHLACYWQLPTNTAASGLIYMAGAKGADGTNALALWFNNTNRSAVGYAKTPHNAGDRIAATSDYTTISGGAVVGSYVYTNAASTWLLARSPWAAGHATTATNRLTVAAGSPLRLLYDGSATTNTARFFPGTLKAVSAGGPLTERQAVALQGIMDRYQTALNRAN